MRPLRLFLCWILVCVSAHAGTLTQADVIKRFPAPLFATCWDRRSSCRSWPCGAFSTRA